MTIVLSDLPNAVRAYLDTEVTVEITKVTSRLEPNEEGTFTIKVTNAAAPTGVRLTDLIFHLAVTDPAVISMKVPGSALLSTRSSTDPDGAVLVRDALVDEMFVFPNSTTIEPSSTLEIGEVTQLELEYRARRAGDASLTCHIHATVDQASLFPSSQRSATDNHPVKVLT